MSSPALLALYSIGVIIAALAGGAIPLWSRRSSRRLEFFLAASAGVMLGVVGAHMLPEAFEEGGAHAAWAVIAGFLFMLIVERFVLPHALHAPHAAEDHEDCDPVLEKEHAKRDSAGIGAFLGLALHTLADGLALGAAMEDRHVAPFVFLAIVVHKIPSAFALGSILVRGGAATSRVLLACGALGAMVGLGGAIFFVASQFGGGGTHGWTPIAVAFSAGSFLHVAVTDLLPDLHRRGSARSGLVFALLGGLGLMILLTFLVPD